MSIGMKKGDPPTATKGKNASLIHLENRIKKVRLLTEQAALTEEARQRLKSTQHATEVVGRGEKVVESRPTQHPRASRPATEAGKKKDAERRDRSRSAKPHIQPSTSKEPARSEPKREEKKPERRPTAKTREMHRDRSRDKQDNSPYAKRSAGSPTSSTESIQRLMDEVKRLKDENHKLRNKVEVDLTNSADLHKWPREDLLKLIAQLESKEVRKPVQAAVRKLQEMGDTMSLHDQLQLARETVQNLKKQNDNLQEQLSAAAKSTPTPPPHIHQQPTTGNGEGDEDVGSKGKNQNGHTIASEKDQAGVITDPALMPRWEYDQIACDIVHATRAAILRKRFMERWKKDREDAEDRRQPAK